MLCARDAGALACTSGRSASAVLRAPPAHRLPALRACRRRCARASASVESQSVDLDSAEKNLQALRREVDRKEAALQVARLTLLEAERRLKERTGEKSAPGACSFDAAYGWNRRFSGSYIDDELPEGLPPTPAGAFTLGLRNFTNEFRALAAYIRGDRSEEMEGQDSDAACAMRAKLDELTLSNKAIWDREHARPSIKAPWIIKAPYFVLCYMLDTIFDGRPLARLWFLETVARVPYFSYISMLHLYESIGWWRIGAAAKRVHFAEEWNEFHHLLIMESLGGDRKWIDRFMAGHSAVVYYWALILMWLISPTLAYNFSELIEAHAVDTYGQFVDENAERLKALPAPLIARRYYTQDLYLYDEFQTSRAQGSRRPKVETLYDVFSAIRDDEAEHVSTMAACQDPEVLVRSPNVEAALAAAAAAAAVAEAVIGNMPEETAAALLSIVEDIVENGSSLL